MTTTFMFDESRYDVAYLCPHTKKHFKILRRDNWREVKFPFFTVIKREGRNILFSCPVCHIEVVNIFNCENPGNFVRCFQRYFPGKDDLK